MRLEELKEGKLSDLMKKFKAWKEDRKQRHIQSVWDKRSDDDIRDAYKDAQDWLSLDADKWGDTMKNIHKSVNERLEKFILPQMKKRGLK